MVNARNNFVSEEIELENLINTLNTQLEEAKTKLKEITNKS